MQVRTWACGNTAVSTSSTPRFLSSVMTRSQNFAPADPARSVSEAAVRDAHRGGLLDPQAQDLLATVGPDAEGEVDRFVADGALIADLHPQRLEEDQG